MREASKRSRWAAAAAVGLGLTTLGASVLGTGPASAAGSGPTDVPMVALGDARVVEGETGRQMAKVPITLSSPLASTAYVRVETVADEKSATPDVDYKHVVKRVRIPAGTTYRTVGIPIYGDDDAEGTEFVGLRITALDASPMGLDKPTGSVVVLDDDSGGATGPTVSVSSARLFEGNPVVGDAASSNKVQLTLALSAAQASDVFVRWHTDDGTAIAGDDFKKVSSRTTRIPAGRMQRTILVTVHGDSVVEPGEDLSVVVDEVSGGAGVGPGVGRGQVVVLDDDGDRDGDGLVDTAEGTYKTDPDDPDTDDDGLSDRLEVTVTRTNPNQWDTDADGLDDLAELKVYGTKPTNADTDGDGWVDGAEVALGADPLDAASFPT